MQATVTTPAALLVPGHHQLPSYYEVHHTHYIMCHVSCNISIKLIELETKVAEDFAKFYNHKELLSVIMY